MHPRDMALMGLPLALLVLLVGGVWHAAMDAEFQAYADEALAREAEGEAFDHLEYNSRYEATQVPVTVSFWTALPLALVGMAGLHARWGAPERPAWMEARATLLWPLACILAVTAVLGVLRAQAPEALGTVKAATMLLLPAAALFWSLLAGYQTAQQARGPRIRTGLAWAVAAALFCVLLTAVVLIPDPTSEDLAFFTVPALVLSGLLAVGFMALGSHPPARAAEGAVHDKP